MDAANGSGPRLLHHQRKSKTNAREWHSSKHTHNSAGHKASLDTAGGEIIKRNAHSDCIMSPTDNLVPKLPHQCPIFSGFKSSPRRQQLIMCLWVRCIPVFFRFSLIYITYSREFTDKISKVMNFIKLLLQLNSLHKQNRYSGKLLSKQRYETDCYI